MQLENVFAGRALQRVKKINKKLDFDPRLKNNPFKICDKDFPFAVGKAAYLAKP
jgi:hypothetical protein